MLNFEVYTDASGNINTKTEKGFGYSAVFYHEDVEYFSSYKISQKELRELLSLQEDVSNPTVEVFAALDVIGAFCRNIKEHGVQEQMSGSVINIYSDYKGVSCWYNREWEMNKNYIRSLIMSMRHFTNKLREMNIKVKVHWVKGHSGIQENERADHLAVQRLDKSNLHEFFENLKQNSVCQSH